MRGIRLVAPLLFVLCLLLAGCGGRLPSIADEGAVLSRLSGNFEADAVILRKTLRCEAHISRSPQDCTMRFTAPDSLQDMTVAFSQEGVEMDYQGLSFDLTADAMPVGSIPRLIAGAVTSLLNREGLEMKSTGGILEVRGQTEAGAFTAELDAETGYILKLYLPGQDLEIRFGEFAFSD